MKHASARNVIKRTFGLLKIGRKTLSSPSYYNITTQHHIINACCLLHNFIRKEMKQDPVEDDIDNLTIKENLKDDIKNVTTIEPTDE